jgi:DNA invertase Pin-like site-specific DNA recombinase
VLVVTRLDRLARSTRDLLNVLATISERIRQIQRRRSTCDGKGGEVWPEAPKLAAHQIAEVKARREAGEALSDVGRSYGVSHSTISRL